MVGAGFSIAGFSSEACACVETRVAEGVPLCLVCKFHLQRRRTMQEGPDGQRAQPVRRRITAIRASHGSLEDQQWTGFAGRPALLKAGSKEQSIIERAVPGEIQIAPQAVSQ